MKSIVLICNRSALNLQKDYTMIREANLLYLQRNIKSAVKNMQEYLEILKQSKLFDQLNEQEILDALSCLHARIKVFSKDEVIFRQGEGISELALLLDGSVHIQREDYWGNLSILNEIHTGDLFGEVYACLENTKMLNNAVAVSPSKALLINANRILTTCPSACRFHERLVHNLLTVLASKNLLLARKLEHLSQRTTREKLLSYLSEQSLKSESSSFDISFNRQQLADYLSVDRSAMSAELGRMKAEGLLEFHKNHFVLKGEK